MSLYRFVRTSALLAVASRYRAKLFRVAAAVATALVTSWVFEDIALYLADHQAGWLGFALIVKTLVVYGALVYGFWQLRPGSWEETRAATGPSPAPRKKPAPAETGAALPDTAQTGPLDELLDKPRLRTRKDAILTQPEKNS